MLLKSMRGMRLKESLSETSIHLQTNINSYEPSPSFYERLCAVVQTMFLANVAHVVNWQLMSMGCVKQKRVFKVSNCTSSGPTRKFPRKKLWHALEP